MLLPILIVIAAAVPHFLDTAAERVALSTFRSPAAVAPADDKAPVKSLASDYQAAKNQWIGDAAVVSGAAQNTALNLAVADLIRGRHSRAGHRSDYGAVIAAITGFAAIPITGVTSAESARARTDVARVDRFFGLRHNPWEKGCLTSGLGIQGAARAWQEEPTGISSGILIAPLQNAAADLTAGLKTDHGDRSCYPAAIEDLENLESATKSEVVRSSRSWSFGDHSATVSVSAEIAYLHGFFGFSDDREVLEGDAAEAVTKRSNVAWQHLDGRSWPIQLGWAVGDAL